MALKNDELYHTGKIIRYCDELGLFDRDIEEPQERISASEKKRSKINARASLSILCNKKMPDPPDGEIHVTRPYKASYRAWYGATWKKVLGANE